MRETAENILEEYGDMIYRIALSRTRKKEDAEDVFQEVFLKYVSAQKEWESAEHCKAWLIRVTMNCCNKIFSTAWSKHVITTDDLSYFSQGTLGGIETKEENSVYLAMTAVPDHYREVLHLFYYEQMSVEEISQILGKKEGTIKSLLHRGREHLEKEWKKIEGKEESK